MSVVDGIRNLQAFRRDPLALLGSVVAEGSGRAVVPFALGVRAAVVVSGDAVAAALDHPRLVRCREPLGPLGTFAGQAPVYGVIGDGLPLLLHGAKERRRPIGVALAAATATAEPVDLNGGVEARLARITDDVTRASDSAVNLVDIVGRVVCEQLCRRLFGDLHAEQAAALTAALDAVTRSGHRQAVGKPLWSSWWGKDVRALQRAKATLAAFADAVLASSSPAPALQALRALPPQTQHDEVITQVLAGTETTTLTVCWLWWLLSAHPDWRARVQEELAPGGVDVASLRLSSDVALMGCLRETLRLYPAFWQLFRVCSDGNDVALADGVVRAGDVVFVDLFHTHRDPRRHQDPTRFDPTRQGEAPTFAFGSGSRSCIGARLASVLIVDVLAALLRVDGLVPAESPEAVSAPEGLVFGLGRAGGFPVRPGAPSPKS